MKKNYYKKNQLNISFFCPAYNDQDNLKILIPKVYKLLKSVCKKFEIVIIDDASPDNTGKVADELAKKYRPFVSVVHHKKNRDYGGAIRSGFDNAKKYQYVFYTDGDNQYDVSELKSALKFIPKYDAVIGYRKNRSVSFTRLVQSYTYNFLVHTFFGIKAKDVGCAFRVVKREFIENIEFNSTSSFVQVEFLIGLQKQNARIKEIPVTHSSRKFGKASGGNPKVILHTISDMKNYALNSLKLKLNS